MKVDYKKITIPRNYVLVLPDHDFENFHIDGKESISAGKVDLENVAAHYSIKGKVFAVPQEIVFNLDRIRANRIPDAPELDFEQTMFYFKTHQVETEGYKQGSVLFDVTMDVRLNDTVYFNYQEHYNCYDHGRYVETEMGDMFLIKYDQLICCHPEDKPAEITMLNGMMFIEPIDVKGEFGDNVIRRAGFDLPTKEGQEGDFKKKLTIGRVRLFGRHCKAYIDQPDNVEGPYDFAPGQIVMYNPKVAPTLEFSLHKTMFEGKNLVKLRRRNIFAILPVDIENGLVENLVTTINVK